MAVLAAANALDVMSATIFVPFLPTLAEDLGASPLVVGLVFTAPAVVSAVVTAPAGYLSDRVGRRPLIWGGVTGSALPVMAVAAAGSPLLLVALRAVDALFRALAGPSMHAYVGDAYAEGRRGRAFGVYQTTRMAGAAVGPIVGGLLAAVGGVRLPFLVLGAGTLCGGLLLFALLPPVGDEPAADETGTNADEGDSPGLLPDLSPRAAGTFLTVPAAAWLGNAFLGAFGESTLDPIFAPLLAETVGRGPAYAGTAYSALAAAVLVFMPIGGRVADRLGRVRVLIGAKAGWFLVMVGLAAAASPLLPPALMFLGGVLSAVAAPASMALRYEIAPDDREATFGGVTGAVSALGRASGPLFAGAVTGAVGVRTAAVAAGVSWLVSIPLLAFFVPEPAAGE